MTNLFHACADHCRREAHVVRKYHRPTRKTYRAILLLGGVMLYLVHHAAPDYEITVTLLLHSMVTLDPTV